MALSVKVPKTVRIKNHRLALVHFLMVFSLLVGLVYFLFVMEHGYELIIPITTSLEIRWDEPETIEGMENFYTDYPAGVDECRFAAEGNHPDTTRWGHNFSSKVACTQLCELDAVLTYQHEREACWSDFKSFGLEQRYTALQFMDSRGRKDLFLITAKSDWVVNIANETRSNVVEVVPQGTSGVINFGYRYQFTTKPKWFPFFTQDQIGLRGTNDNAITVIVGPDGRAFGDPIPAGQPIKFRVRDIFEVLERPGTENGPRPTVDALINGAEVGVEASCFGTDRDVNTYLRDQARDANDLPPGMHLGASLTKPACLIRFILAGDHYQVNVDYTSRSKDGDAGVLLEVVSETRGFYFKVVGGAGAASVKDMTQLIMSVASMLVFLSLPTIATSFIAVRLLGPISQMYKRTIIEPYDIEEQSAGIATVLAANVNSFHKLATRVPDGEPLIKLETIMSLMGRALEKRSQTLDERETASLSYFLYDKMHRRDPQETHEVGSIIPDCDIFFQWSSEAADKDRPDGISLDQWNQVRLDCEKVTFDAIVHLFDKDRQRHCLEKFFTPSGIRKALLRAMTIQERAQSSSKSNLMSAAKGSVFSFLDRIGMSRSTSGSRGASSEPSPSHIIASSRNMSQFRRGFSTDSKDTDRSGASARSVMSGSAVSIPVNLDPERDASGLLITPPNEEDSSFTSPGRMRMEAAAARARQRRAKSRTTEGLTELTDLSPQGDEVGKQQSTASTRSANALHSFLQGSSPEHGTNAMMPAYAAPASAVSRCFPSSPLSGEHEAMAPALEEDRYNSGRSWALSDDMLVVPVPEEPEPGPEPRQPETVRALRDVEQRLGIVELAVRRLALPELPPPPEAAEPAASSSSPPMDMEAARTVSSEPPMHNRQSAEAVHSSLSTRRRQYGRRWGDQQQWAKAIMESLGQEIVSARGDNPDRQADAGAKPKPGSAPERRSGSWPEAKRGRKAGPGGARGHAAKA